MTVVKKNEQGVVYAFVGDGKGKTSAGLGITLRMLALKKKVVWVSWYKCKDWDISEMRMESIFPDFLKMFWMGVGFYLKDGTKEKAVGNRGRVYDAYTPLEHRDAAVSALNTVRTVLSVGIPNWGIPDLIVMDEVLKAVDDELVGWTELEEIVDKRGGCHLVLTGRNGNVRRLERIADLISEVKKVKHPFDRGLLAIKGLDF